MALPILDGNQSATTLSTILAGGEHTPAHTVVSLGATAISNITSAVSGSVVSISNFPASQSTTFGAVTGSVSVINFPATQGVTFSQASITFGTAVVTGSTSILNFPVTQAVTFGTAVITGSTNIIGTPSVTFTQASITFGATTGSVSVLNFPATQGISGTVTANLSRPTWADYSGAVATAGTAVTAIGNTSRSYLLAQVTTGQMFLNIGATATTLNSVYFSAGQGFAWETSVPQGIVSIISSVTGTKYVLKEG
jgi:hypothetical protein